MNESEYKRLVAIQSLNILDTETEAIFDDAVQLASTICGTPMSLVSIIDHNRQWFKARIGVDLIETPVEYAFCKHAIAQQGLFVVADAREDARFQNNPLVTGKPGIRFYAGMPLVTADALALGTLCVIDVEPRELTEVQTASLKLLARQVTAFIDMRTKLSHFHKSLMELSQRAQDNPQQSATAWPQT